METKEYIRILLLKLLKETDDLKRTVMIKMILDELDKI